MKLVAIEPTPSPHTMKLRLAEETTDRMYYSLDEVVLRPDIVNQLLEIEGVRSIYHVSDFFALEKYPKADWGTILRSVKALWGEEFDARTVHHEASVFGAIHVFVQFARNIPLQIKLQSGLDETRVGLPSNYREAVMALSQEGENVVVERKWVDYGIRYGTFEEVGNEIYHEVLAVHPNPLVTLNEKRKLTAIEQMDLENEDWRIRYAAFAKIQPTMEDLATLQRAAKDANISIRRMAIVYLGMIKQPEVLPILCDSVLHDPAISVRRTAGDCLSDISDPAAVPTMEKALFDKSPLVRWRAAMFLYESANESSLPVLELAQSDEEFEVALQVNMAIARIQGGEVAEGSIWKQMTTMFQQGR
jgi:hypothetical protein